MSRGISWGDAMSGTASGMTMEMMSPVFTGSRGLAGLLFRRMCCSRMRAWIRERERSFIFEARKASRRSWGAWAEIWWLKIYAGEAVWRRTSLMIWTWAEERDSGRRVPRTMRP